MKKTILIVFVLFWAEFSFAQIQDGSYWHDGSCFYQATNTDTSVLFLGGNLHEGGWGDNLLKTDNPNTFSETYQVHKDEYTTDSVVHTFLEMPEGRSEVLLFYSNFHRKGRALSRIWTRFESPSPIWNSDTTLKVFRQIVEDDMNSMIEGVYAGDEAWRYTRISPYQIVREDGTKPIDTLSYVFWEDLIGFPNPMLVLSNGERVWYKITSTGLNLYEAVLGGTDPEDWYEKGKLLMTLRKKWSTTPVQGHFPQASSRPLTCGLLNKYNNESLRLMRNEMFARQGYQFSDQKLQQHFYNELWYWPNDNNANVKLSQLETTNLQLIKYVESFERKKVEPQGRPQMVIPMTTTVKEYAWMSHEADKMPVLLVMEVRSDGVVAGHYAVRVMDTHERLTDPDFLIGDFLIDCYQKPFYSLHRFDFWGNHIDYLRVYIEEDGTAKVFREDSTGNESVMRFDSIVARPADIPVAFTPVKDGNLRYAAKRLPDDGNDYKNLLQMNIKDGKVDYDFHVTCWTGQKASQSNMDDQSRSPIMKNGQFRVSFPACEAALRVDVFEEFAIIRNLSYPSWRNEPCAEFNSCYEKTYFRLYE
ncbi:MAG: YARHG domain-containing protein [Bacteroidales bacterium]|nr:YARHG domain-containing protein [Bacteroidales bacterium]